MNENPISDTKSRPEKDSPQNSGKTPGHWLLARLGKRVLRPGGAELTRRMVADLAVTSEDDVVEFAPGLGHTAELVLRSDPHSYTGVEADNKAAIQMAAVLTKKKEKNKKKNNEGSKKDEAAPVTRCVVGRAQHTGLPDTCASVVYGEAMLTMQPDAQKTIIVQEAARILRKGGRYAVHELSLIPDDLPPEKVADLHKKLSKSIKVGARPHTISGWSTLLTEAGLTVETTQTAPMHLLEPSRLIQDEGWRGAAHFLWNLLRDKKSRTQVRAMRTVFRENADHLGAVALVARKP